MNVYSQLFVAFHESETLRGDETADGDAVKGSRLPAEHPAAVTELGEKEYARNTRNRSDATLPMSVRSMRVSDLAPIKESNLDRAAGHALSGVNDHGKIVVVLRSI